MIWTLLAFGITLYILCKLAFPRIGEALDKRQRAIEESIDSAERTKAEAEELLAEYRERLERGARSRPTRSSPARARPARPPRRESLDAARVSARSSWSRRARDIEAETRRAIQEIRKRGRRPHRAGDREGHPQDARRRRPAPPRRRGARRAGLRPALRRAGALGTAMEEIAQVYARVAVRGRRGAGQARRRPRAARRSSPTRSTRTGDCGVLLLALLLHARRRRTGCTRRARGRRPGDRLNFLELLIEKHRMPAIFRIRREYDGLWDAENKILPVQVTSARRARRGDREAHRRPHRRADRPAGRAHRARSSRTSSAASSCASATRSSTRRSATASSNFASRSRRRAARA